MIRVASLKRVAMGSAGLDDGRQCRGWRFECQFIAPQAFTVHRSLHFPLISLLSNRLPDWTVTFVCGNSVPCSTRSTSRKNTAEKYRPGQPGMVVGRRKAVAAGVAATFLCTGADRLQMAADRHQQISCYLVFSSIQSRTVLYQSSAFAAFATKCPSSGKYSIFDLIP